MIDTRANRRKIYVICRKALRSDEMDFAAEALQLVEPLDGNKALGLKIRLQRKLDGLPFNWNEV